MDPKKISWLVPSAAPDPLETTLLEIELAISLVVAGVAVSVTLCCLEAAESAAFTGAAWAQTAGVAFGLRRDPSSPAHLVIGPRLRRASGALRVVTGS